MIEQKIMPLVKKNVLSNNEYAFDEEENMDIDEENIINTRIYSDCYSSYQVNDVLNMGYLLKRVNHSVWFDMAVFILIISKYYGHRLKD